MKIDLKDRPILRDLGNGLILCRSTAADIDALAEFNARIHSDDGFDKPDLRVGAWVRDLLTRPHPTFHPKDFTIVAEMSSGRIVSSMNLISQAWAYEGIPFKVGRPELVGTLPEFRKRGLVRQQFEEIHRWSAARGELVQGITGIPFYYRLFGYEMALELGGGRVGFEAQLPVLKESETEPFTIRTALETDIPFLMEVYAHACRRKLVTSARGADVWRYELTGQDAKNVNHVKIRILELTRTGEPVGYLVHPWYNWGTGLVAFHYELKPGISWLEVTPSVARYLWQTGETYSNWDGKLHARTTYAFWFGTDHPAYSVFRDRLPRVRKPYAWYIRVPDLPAFLGAIAPALEQHIANSPVVGYSGELTIGFYRTGIRIGFEQGKLTGVSTWQPDSRNPGKAAFPNLTFIQLLFGYRDVDELCQAYADCYYENDETRVLLETLFPKKASTVMMLN